MNARALGDADAFDLLIEARIARLLRLAMSITIHEADARDAVQNGCLRAWMELPRLREPAAFDAWLWRIVINACRSTLRQRRRHSVREIDIAGSSPIDVAAPGPSLAERSSGVDVVQRAFARLDVDKRTLLILHHVEDRSIGDIAGLLRIPEGTTKWRLHAARQALERALEAERR